MDPLTLAIGTVAFWVLFGIVAIIMWVLIEYEWSVLPLIVLGGVGVLFKYFGGFDPFSWALDHPWLLGKYVLAWFGIGTVYCVGKWYLYVHAEKRRYRDARREFLKKHDIKGDDIPKNLMLEWEEFLARWYDDEFGIRYEGPVCVNPQVNNNKRKVFMWIVYWPWSAIWTIIDDPVKRLVRAIYHRIKGFMQWISDRAFADTRKDFLSKEERALAIAERDKRLRHGAPAVRGEDDETLSRL